MDEISLHEEFEELSLLSLALLASRVSSVFWKFKNDKLRSISEEEKGALSEAKKFIVQVRSGSMVTSQEGTAAYLPDLESVKAYDHARRVWSFPSFQGDSPPDDEAVLEKIDSYEHVIDSVERYEQLSPQDLTEANEKVDEVQEFFTCLSDTITDLLDEVEIRRSKK